MKRAHSPIMALITIAILASSFTSVQEKDIFQPRTIKKNMLKAAKWQLKNPKHDLHDSANGAFYAGVMAAYQATGSKALYKAMISMGDQNQWTPGKRLQHADDYAICQTYIDLYRLTKDPKMIQALKDSVDKFIRTPYETKGISQTAWWWCDALFMMPPTLVKLGETLHNKRYIEVSDSLFHATYDLLYDKNEHLFFRAASVRPSTRWGKHRWRQPGANGIQWEKNILVPGQWLGDGWPREDFIRITQRL